MRKRKSLKPSKPVMYFVVGQIFDFNGMLVGYKILNISHLERHEKLNMSLKMLNISYETGGIDFVNAYYKQSLGKLVGTIGSLDNYPSFYYDGTSRDKEVKISVVCEIFDKATNSLSGYIVSIGNALIRSLSLDDIVTYCCSKSFGFIPSNFTLERVNGSIVVKPLSGKFYRQAIDKNVLELINY